MQQQPMQPQMPMAMAPGYQPQAVPYQGQQPVAGVPLGGDPNAGMAAQGYGQPTMGEQIPVGMHPSQQMMQPAQVNYNYTEAPAGMAPMPPK